MTDTGPNPQHSSAPSPSLVRALRVKYSVFLATSIAAIFAFPPTLDELTTHTYVVLWIALLGIGALFALIGSIRPAPRVEFVGVSLVCIALASYSAAFIIQAVFSDRAILFYVLALASIAWIVIPTWRAGDLWIWLRTRQSLRKRGLIP